MLFCLVALLATAKHKFCYLLFLKKATLFQETQTSGSINQTGTPEYAREFSHSDRSSFTPPSSTILKPRGGSVLDTLDQEFRLVNACLPNLTINEVITWTYQYVFLLYTYGHIDSPASLISPLPKNYVNFDVIGSIVSL